MAAPILVLSMLAITCVLTTAFEPSPLQDFCVTDPNSSVLVCGLVYLDSKLVQVDHFYFSRLNNEGNTSNKFGSAVTPVFVNQIPGLKTLGISLVRLDDALEGLIPPHTHPRATEILTVLEDLFTTKEIWEMDGLFPYLVEALGLLTMANAVFWSKTSIPADIIVKAFYTWI